MSGESIVIPTIPFLILVHCVLFFLVLLKRFVNFIDLFLICGAWVAQSVKRPTLGFSSSHDLIASWV